MTATQIRSRMHKYIDRVDERFLNAMYAMLEEYLKKGFSGEENYTKSGKPMSVDTLKKRIRKAEARIDSGKFTTQEDLEKEMEKW